jgi:acetolactate synthase-1/2/3 large subunit
MLPLRNPRTLSINSWGVYDKLKAIKIDIDPAEMDRIRAPDIAVIGHAAPILKCLSEHLAKLSPMRPDRVAASRRDS